MIKTKTLNINLIFKTYLKILKRNLKYFLFLNNFIKIRE